MNSIDHLFEDAADTTEAKVSGKWFPIRLVPDLATGELLNVGVGFIDSRRKLHVKILDSARVFECMYGPAGLENFTFLLTVLREHFQKTAQAISPSPHIVLGARSYAAGESVPEILESLYQSQVTLARNACSDDTDENNIKRVDNLSLRKIVFKDAQRRAPALFDRMFRTKPVSLPDKFGQRHELDLPIYADDHELFRNGARYATFISGFFRSAVYRGFNLDGGVRNLWNTRAIVPESSHGGLFILRPPEGTEGYTPEVMLAIDNDIDRIVWPFLKMKNMAVEVSADPAKLTEAGLALAE